MVGAAYVGDFCGGGALVAAFAFALRLGRRFAAAAPVINVADWISVRRVSFALAMT
jgi:hypothetical protein